MSGRDEAAGGVRMQELGEVTDFPDIDEYLPTKEAAQQVLAERVYREEERERERERERGREREIHVYT